jgi:hypothetical protein
MLLAVVINFLRRWTVAGLNITEYGLFTSSPQGEYLETAHMFINTFEIRGKFLVKVKQALR